jgi:hypothetical protein
MRMTKKDMCRSLLFLLAAASSIPAQSKSAQSPAQSPQDAERSCRTFVQGFYSWYVPKHGLEDVLKYRRSAISPELYSALKEDLAASAKNKDEVVGLDFDPFLNAQDTAERYVIGKVTAKGATFWVDIYGIWSGKKSDKPDVVAEVACKEGKCLFVNFHYGKTELPENENLQSVLKALKKEREKH